MISRCQSDIILSNRFIETHYKRVDKNIEKCKALLRGIQKEFKKTRDFWEQLKDDENSVTQESESSFLSHNSGSKNSEESAKNEDVNLRNKLKNENVCSKKAKYCSGTGSKKADELSGNSPKVIQNSSKNVEDLQEEANSFSKISKLDVKHLEAFLDIVQKTQVSQCRNKNESNSIEDYSSDLDTFEDALCQLSSVTSLTFESLTNSDVEHDGEENLSPNRFQINSDVKLPESLTEGISRLADPRVDKVYIYIDKNSPENSKKTPTQNVDNFAGIIVPKISESPGLNNETRMPSFDDSDSDVFHEACDFSYSETIEEIKSSPFLYHAKVYKGGNCEAKTFDVGNDKIVKSVSKPTDCRKLLDTKGSKNERVVKFSGSNQITYKNESRINGLKFEQDKGELNKYQKKYSQSEKQIENRSRPRIRVTKQRKLIKVSQKDRSKTRSRSRKKSYHDIAVGTSDLDISEYFNQWPQRLLKQRDPFYSLPAKRRHFDYSTEEPSGIFHPSLLQPYNVSDKCNGTHVERELFVKRNSSWNSLFKPPLSNNELSDNGSNTTYSIKRSSSSDQGHFPTKRGDHPSEDRISIHNSTILNNSNTNIYVFRSFEGRFKPPQASDSDREIQYFNTGNAKKSIDQIEYSESESSRGRASCTDRKLKKKKYLTAKSRKQGALNGEKTNLSREMKQNDSSNSKKGAPVSKVQAVIPYVGHIHSDQIEIPHCTQLVNETKILHSRHSLTNCVRFCNHECVIRKQKRLLAGESDLVGKKNIDVIFNNKSQSSLDVEKQILSSREKYIRRPSSSPLSFSSKRDDKDAGIRRSSREDCRLQLVNGKGDIHLSEVRSPHNSSTSLNREYTVSKMDRTSTKPASEPRVLFKISASSDDLRKDKLNSNENLGTINLTKSSSSCSGIESEVFSKMKMKKFGKNYLSCNDLINDDHFYSKINIIPLPGDDKGLIQQVSIVGQRLWVQGATISGAYKNGFNEQEEEKKPDTNKNSTASDDSKPASSPKKSDVDKSNEKSDKPTKNSNEKSDKSTKNNDNVIKEVTKKKPVNTPHIKVNRKNETTEPKPRFCPYVNKNYLPTNKLNYKASNINKSPERKAQLSPTQPSVKPKVEDRIKLNEKEKIVEKNEKSSNIAAAVHDSLISNNFKRDTENCNNLPVSTNMEVRCGQALSVVNDGNNMSREIDGNSSSLKINSGNKIDERDDAEESDKSNETLSIHKNDESLVVNSSIKSTSKISNNEHDRTDNSGEKINTKLQRDCADLTVTRGRSQQSDLDSDRDNKQGPRRSPSKTVRFKKRSRSNGRDSSSEENIDQLEEVKRVRQNLCSILPNECSFRQVLLKKLNSVDKKNKTSANKDDVDVFGAPLLSSTGVPFYNDHGYPIAQMSGVSLYNSKGVPTKGAYGRPLHTTLKKELAKIVEGSEERRNVFHRMNRNFEEQLLHTLQTTSNWKIDEFGRVYDAYGRPLFDRYGYLLYDHIGNPLTDAFGRKLTDKYGISIMGPRKKCANVMLTNLSSNESIYTLQSSDERLVKNRTELINKKRDTINKEHMWKKCKRQVSFNMDPTIITMSHSDSEGETHATNFKR